MLAGAGHTVFAVRRAAAGGGKARDAQWDVQTGRIEFPGPVDVLVHLAGRSISSRWSAKVKKEVFESRGPATQRLCEFLAQAPADTRPRALICASAIGIYGDRGDEVLTENSAPAAEGASFMSDVCRAWEAATRPAEEAGIQVVHVRVGVVLARDGGALAKMLLPTKLGLAGPVGRGTQYMPWISLTDISRLLMRLATAREPLVGVINGVGPAPVRQHEFIRTLGKVVHRPTVFPMPGFVVKLLFGQMGAELLLGSLRVMSTRLPAGFTFEHETLEAAIRGELGLR